MAGFLKRLFKKKPGGSKIGNLLRGVTGAVSGLGIPFVSQAAGLVKMGLGKAQSATALPAAESYKPSMEDYGAGMVNGMKMTYLNSPAGKDKIIDETKNWFEKNWTFVAIGALSLVLVIIAIVSLISKKSKRR